MFHFHHTANLLLATLPLIKPLKCALQPIFSTDWLHSDTVLTTHLYTSHAALCNTNGMYPEQKHTANEQTMPS